MSRFFANFFFLARELLYGSGFVLCSTAWSYEGGEDINAVAVVKISDSLELEWSQMYGMKGGNSQVFDMLVDNDGNYLLGGHTTIGTGVVNWDYLALKAGLDDKPSLTQPFY